MIVTIYVLGGLLFVIVLFHIHEYLVGDMYVEFEKTEKK